MCLLAFPDVRDIPLSLNKRVNQEIVICANSTTDEKYLRELELKSQQTLNFKTESGVDAVHLLNANPQQVDSRK
jgi:hypothetical protein